MLRWARRRRQLPVGPVLRAVLESGETFDDPSEDHLFMLLEDVDVGDQGLLIVERPADASVIHTSRCRRMRGATTAWSEERAL